jgi:UDP-N-acetylglucosamine 2-epimerase (non-hydrolysing)
MAGRWKEKAIPPKWDGKAAERIVEQLEHELPSQ